MFIIVFKDSNKEEETSLNHFFVHIIPRKEGDFQENDEIYVEISKFSGKFQQEYLKTQIQNKQQLPQEFDKLSQQSQKMADFLQKMLIDEQELL